MKIEHAAIYVNDLKKAREFFEMYFEGKAGNLYRNQKTGFTSYFISFEDGARLELMNRPNMKDMVKYLCRTGYAHLTFSTGSAENVDILTERLRKDGYEIISGPRVTGDGYYESCVLGFENNQIEITV